MKPRIVVILTLVVFLLLASGAIASAQTSRDRATFSYQVEVGVAAGKDYRLSNLTWQVSGAISGGEYRMLDPISSTVAGSGCCCTFLPCLTR
jgi:hypothetical protein